MNVAHFTTLSDDDSDGNGIVYGSVGSSNIYKDSSDEAEAKSTGSSVDSSHLVIHSAYMMNASGENGERSDSEDSSDDDVQDDASVECDKYSANKLMMCEVCKVMVRKDTYPVCHDYKYTSENDSEGGAKAHDPTAKRLEYCDVCNRSVTFEQRRNLSCHTYCIFCGVDVPHNDCAEFESRGTRSSSVKTE